MAVPAVVGRSTTTPPGLSNPVPVTAPTRPITVPLSVPVAAVIAIWSAAIST
jgi:hypothetical protein